MTKEISGKEPVYGLAPALLPESTLFVVQTVAWVVLTLTIAVAVLYLMRGEKRSPCVTHALMGLWAFWVIVPPLWFSYEYFFIFKALPLNTVPFETFKYGQDTAAKAWLGIAVVLSGILKK